MLIEPKFKRYVLHQLNNTKYTTYVKGYSSDKYINVQDIYR